MGHAAQGGLFYPRSELAGKVSVLSYHRQVLLVRDLFEEETVVRAAWLVPSTLLWKLGAAASAHQGGRANAAAILILVLCNETAAIRTPAIIQMANGNEHHSAYIPPHGKL